MSPMAKMQVSPAARWAAVGGHGKFAASVAPLPLVVQLGIEDVVVVLLVSWAAMQLGALAVVGGPVAAGAARVPPFTAFAPDRVPSEWTVVMEMAVQLTGTDVPR